MESTNIDRNCLVGHDEVGADWREGGILVMRAASRPT